ncbi:hypothetical protein MUCCIDRAFT_104709 [Mucor lusitanicus CBS 277.49]|uniref:Uncharacterized protein n=1 Tax=Mucor lusitanicus CBS 277.49 TaxID=747725 RepID=A0A162R2T2_MUCCL|nr:hypothetical protein MUCCIDRAFT_104709 [Mucor lusitanicus CBS 277.49]
MPDQFVKIIPNPITDYHTLRDAHQCQGNGHFSTWEADTIYPESSGTFSLQTPASAIESVTSFNHFPDQPTDAARTSVVDHRAPEMEWTPSPAISTDYPIILLKTLQWLLMALHPATLITPNWLTAPWYPMTLQLARCAPPLAMIITPPHHPIGGDLLHKNPV